MPDWLPGFCIENINGDTALCIGSWYLMVHTNVVHTEWIVPEIRILDLIVVTIAAISVGIAIHNTIHYVHRVQHEYRQTPDYLTALKNSITSIGQAKYFTTVVTTP